MTWPPTVEDLKDYLGNEKATEDDAFYEGAIDAALEVIQDETQREFTLVDGSTTATARLFVPTHPNILRIHDCTTVTAVSNNGTAISSGAYQLEPVGAINRTGAARPYEQIRLLYGQSWYFYRGKATVSITAKWGWPQIPQRIQEALKLVAKDIVLNREVRFGIVEMSTIGGVSARTNPVVRAAIERYSAAEAWGIG